MKRLLMVLTLFTMISQLATAQTVKTLTTAGADCTTATSCLTFNTTTQVGVTIQLSGTFTATVQFEATPDGTNWRAILGYPIPTGAGATNATAGGTWQFNTAGLKFIRARCSAFTSAPTVTINSSVTPFVPPAATTVAVGAVDQGTGGASAWLVNGTGGTFPVTGTFYQTIQPVAPWANGTLSAGVTAAIVDTTSTQVIAGTALNYLYLGSCSVTNSHASVGTLVNFQDGTGGTTLFTLAAASGFGGHQTQWIVPRKVPTAGNGVFCAPVTTGASIVCSCSGFKSTVSY